MISFMMVIPDNPEYEALDLYSSFYDLKNTFKW